MFCGQCGKEIDSGLKFCKYCGSPVDMHREVLANQQAYGVDATPTRSFRVGNIGSKINGAINERPDGFGPPYAANPDILGLLKSPIGSALLVALCGIMVFISSFLEWIGYASGFHLMIHSAVVFDSYTIFTGFWSLVLGFFLGYCAYLLYTENEMAGRLTLLGGIAGSVIPIVVVVVAAIRGHHFYSPLVGLWVLFVFSVIAAVLGHLVPRGMWMNG